MGRVIVTKREFLEHLYAQPGIEREHTPHELIRQLVRWWRGEPDTWMESQQPRGCGTSTIVDLFAGYVASPEQPLLLLEAWGQRMQKGDAIDRLRWTWRSRGLEKYAAIILNNPLSQAERDSAYACKKFWGFLATLRASGKPVFWVDVNPVEQS